MSEEFSVQQTLNQYSIAASRADWDAYVATFVPDGVWAIPALDARFEGHDAIRAGALGFCETLDYIVQVHCPGLITVDGDTATAQSVIRECGKQAGKDEALEVLGIYNDTLVKTADGWKFKSRIFELQGMHSFPLLPQPQH